MPILPGTTPNPIIEVRLRFVGRIVIYICNSMSDTPDNLLAQLSRRVQCFLSATGISQRKPAKLIKTDETHLANFLAGRTGLSAEKSLKLVQLLNTSKAQLERKFNGKAVTSQIVSLQQRGKPLQLDSAGAWTPGLSGQDPNGSDDITGVKTARDLDNADDYQAKITAFLKDQQSIYRQAIAHIDNYLANVRRAKVNRAGSTEGARTVNTNDKSSHPGSRGDLLSADKLREQLEFVRREREKTEERLELEAELQKERAAYWDARVKAARKELKAR